MLKLFSLLFLPTPKSAVLTPNKEPYSPSSVKTTVPCMPFTERVTEISVFVTEQLITLQPGLLLSPVKVQFPITDVGTIEDPPPPGD